MIFFKSVCVLLSKHSLEEDVCCQCDLLQSFELLQHIIAMHFQLQVRVRMDDFITFSFSFCNNTWLSSMLASRLMPASFP